MKVSYLFDFDGTLVDSMPTFVSAMLRILDENGITYDDSVIKTITPLGVAGTAEYYVNTLGVKKSKEEVMHLMKEYMKDAYFNTIPPKKNVIKTLKALKEMGASLNVLTASPHITLDACLKRLDMWDLFDNVWSCDDFCTGKSDPEIYVKAAERMGTTVDKVLFLDDNINADKTAKSAGCMVCGVYDDSSKDVVDQMKKATDYYIYDFLELLNINL
ncbi:MAG: HAD family phosphatase [Ruminococcaceae bacterium]|nr:HAD family phosphatase [Oscillospiraceae bacterium]